MLLGLIFICSRSLIAHRFLECLTGKRVHDREENTEEVVEEDEEEEVKVEEVKAPSLSTSFQSSGTSFSFSLFIAPFVHVTFVCVSSRSGGGCNRRWIGAVVRCVAQLRHRERLPRRRQGRHQGTSSLIILLLLSLLLTALCLSSFLVCPLFLFHLCLCVERAVVASSQRRRSR